MLKSQIWVVSLAFELVLTVVGSRSAPAGEPVTTEGPRESSFINGVPACHYRTIHYESPGNPAEFDRDYDGPPKVRVIEEGWAVRGVGRRVEVRREGELVSLTVETPRWRFLWYAKRNVVIAYPSRLNDQQRIGDSPIRHREWTKRWSERLKATHVTEKDRLNGKEVEKMTFRYLAEPDGDQCIHDRKAGFEERLRSPDAVFRTRAYWFDCDTHLLRRRKCGCKFPRHDDWVDYPSPESIPRDLFRFQVPRDATLEIKDPALGRPIVSEIPAGPDLRD